MPKYLVHHETRVERTITSNSFRVENNGILYFFNFGSFSFGSMSVPEQGIAAFRAKEWECVTIVEEKKSE